MSIIILLNSIFKSHGIIVECSAFLFLFYGCWLLLLDSGFRWWNRVYAHSVLLAIFIECLLNPILLVWVLPSSDYILFPPRDISLDILHLSDVLPATTRLNQNSLVEVLSLIPFATSHSRFSEVHDVECVCCALYTPSCPEIEPLLVASCVCIHLHVEVVHICARNLFFSLQKVSWFKKTIKLEDRGAILLFQALYSLFVIVNILKKPTT